MSEQRKMVHLSAAIAALAVGLLVYLIDRQPASVYFVPDWLVLAKNTAPIFGGIGNHLPTFLHVFAFVLLTILFVTPGPSKVILICIGWFTVEVLFEIGQITPISQWITGLVPTWFDGIPFLENISNYFLAGTFDSLDLLSIAGGVIAAYLVYLITASKSSNQQTNVKRLKKPKYGYPFVLLISLGLVSIVGSGDGGSEEDSYDFGLTYEPESGSVIDSSAASIRGTTYYPERPPMTDWSSDGCPLIDCPESTVITISWRNQTNGDEGLAAQSIGNSCYTFFGWCRCECIHSWLATVPLELGNNSIVITATYPAVDSRDYGITLTRLLERPTNVTAIAAEERDRIILSWDDVIDADSYVIYWSTSRDITPENAPRLVGVVSPYTIDGLAENVPYYFLVKAVSGEHESNLSDLAWAVPGWNKEQVATDIYPSNDTSIAVDSAGNPLIHYTSGYNNYYATRGTGIWSNSLISEGRTADIALSFDDTVNVSYHNTSGVVFSTLSSGVWSPVSVYDVTPEYDSVDNAALSLDQNNIAHMIYRRSYYSIGTSDDLYYANNGSGFWSRTHIDDVNSFNSFERHTQGGRIYSLAVDDNGAAHIAYVNATQLQYATNQSGSWMTETIDSNNNQQVAVGLDSGGGVHIVYSDFYGNLMYANNTAGTWTTAQIDNETRSYYPSLVVSYNTLHIVYFKAVTNEVRYRTIAAGGFSSMVPLDSFEANDYSLGVRTDIAVDDQGYIHISYLNGSDLMYLSNR